MPRTITAEVPAYLFSIYYGPQDLQRPDAEVANLLTLRDMSASPDYVRVGTAQVTIDLVDQSEMVANKVEALKAQKQRTLADAQAKATAIESQIQQLLAITHEVQA